MLIELNMKPLTVSLISVFVRVYSSTVMILCLRINMKSFAGLPSQVAGMHQLS